MIHALKWLLKVFGITKWFWNRSKLAGKQTFVQKGSKKAATRLPQTREQAASHLPPSD